MDRQYQVKEPRNSKEMFFYRISLVRFTLICGPWGIVSTFKNNIDILWLYELSNLHCQDDRPAAAEWSRWNDCRVGRQWISWYLCQMVMTLDDYSLIGAYVRSNLCYSILLRLLIRAVTNRIFSSEQTYFPSCVRNMFWFTI